MLWHNDREIALLGDGGPFARDVEALRNSRLMVPPSRTLPPAPPAAQWPDIVQQDEVLDACRPPDTRHEQNVDAKVIDVLCEHTDQRDASCKADDFN
jgi:hypothetical protein